MRRPGANVIVFYDLTTRRVSPYEPSTHLSRIGFSRCTVIDSKDTRIIGSSRYHGFDETQGEIEIGWTFLAKSHWGGTYNRELKRLMLHHAFKFVSSVIFLVEPNNLRSQRAIEKIGGVRSDSRTDGSGRKSLVYRIMPATGSMLRCRRHRCWYRAPWVPGWLRTE